MISGSKLKTPPRRGSSMIGLVVATHGSLAEAFVDSGKLIVGNIGNVAQLGLFHGDSIEQFEIKIRRAIEQTDEGDGVIVLTDLLGGSPCNVSARAIGSLYKDRKLECFYGINLPIFLEAVTSRSFMDFDQLKEHMEKIFQDTYGVLSSKISYSACEE